MWWSNSNTSGSEAARGFCRIAVSNAAFACPLWAIKSRSISSMRDMLRQRSPFHHTLLARPESVGPERFPSEAQCDSQLQEARLARIGAFAELRVPEQRRAEGRIERAVDGSVMGGVGKVYHVETCRQPDPASQSELSSEPRVEPPLTLRPEPVARRSGRDVVEAIAVAVEVNVDVGGVGTTSLDGVDRPDAPVVEDGFQDPRLAL